MIGIDIQNLFFVHRFLCLHIQHPACNIRLSTVVLINIKTDSGTSRIHVRRAPVYFSKRMTEHLHRLFSAILPYGYWKPLAGTALLHVPANLCNYLTTNSGPIKHFPAASTGRPGAKARLSRTPKAESTEARSGPHQKKRIAAEFARYSHPLRLRPLPETSNT